MVVVGELAIVFDDAVLVPVALRCLEGVDDPGFLIEARDEGGQVRGEVGAGFFGGGGRVELVLEEVDFYPREVEVCADEVAEGRGAVCFAELGGVAGGVQLADAEDVDEVQGAEGGGVGAEDFDEGFVVCDPAFELEGAEEGEVAGGDEVVEGLEGL